MQTSSVCDFICLDAIASEDALSVMIQKEQTVYKNYDCDYLCALTPHDENCVIITPEDRVKIVDWAYSIIDGCNFSRESVAIAMELVHRFLSKNGSSFNEGRKGAALNFLSDRKQYQLLAITCLYISVKINEHIVLGSDIFAELSRGVYTKEEIECTERIVLHGLSWNVCPPTSSQMANYILSLIYSRVHLDNSTWRLIFDEVQYQTECAVRDYYLSTERPSTIAMASILNTIYQVPHAEQQHSFLSAVMSVVNEDEFASPQEILVIKNRLQCLLRDVDEGQDCDEVSRSSSQHEVCSAQTLPPSGNASNSDETMMLLGTPSLDCVAQAADESYY